MTRGHTVESEQPAKGPDRAERGGETNGRKAVREDSVEELGGIIEASDSTTIELMGGDEEGEEESDGDQRGGKGDQKVELDGEKQFDGDELGEEGRKSRDTWDCLAVPP